MFKEITYCVKITNRCNLKCDYCFTDLDDDDMEICTIKDLLVKSRGYKSVELVIMGGEPLLMGLDYLREIRSIVNSHIEKTKQYVKLSLVTNGMLLEDEHFSIFDLVNVSYDGHKLGQKGNGFIRRKIKQYSKRITVTVVVSANNFKHLQSIYDELEDFGVRRMFVNMDVYASRQELMLYKKALMGINYRKGRTRISLLDAMESVRKDGHYGNNIDMVVGIANLGALFAIEPNGDIRPSILKQTSVYANLSGLSHMFEVYQTPMFMADANKYISSVTDDLIQGSFLDNFARDNEDFRDIFNDKETLIC